jgi:dipeptidyl aminopeptidase/acylaminoacyl peptidase
MIRNLAASMAVAGFTFATAALAEPPPVEDYGKLPALTMVALSPSGDRYAFVADVDGTRKLVIATTDNQPLMVAPIGTAKVRGIDWAGDNHLLLDVSATAEVGLTLNVDKKELWSCTAINVDTHTEVQIFTRQDTIQHAVFGRYGAENIKGHWYGFFGGITMELARGSVSDYNFANETDHQINTDLYKVDLDNGAAELLARGEPDSSDWLIDADGKIVARSFYHERSGNWSVRSGDFGGVQLDAGKDSFGGASLLGLGRTQGTILISKPGDDGRVSEEAPLAGGPPAAAADLVGQDAAITDPRTHAWIGMVKDGDNPVTTLFDPALEAKFRGTLKAFPGYRVRLESWSADFNRMIVFTDGGDDSGTYWIVDIPTGSANVLGNAYPSIAPDRVGPISMIDYKAADGLALRGVLTLPPGRTPKNLPLIVLPHGGPEERDYPGFDWWAQAYVSRGYAVFQPNFRGSAGYGLKFRNAGFGEWGRKMQTDISDGVTELAKEGLIDSKRVCIVGGSYGGYAALAGVTVQQGLYRCAVSVAGVSDPAAMIYASKDEGDSDKRYWKTFMGQTSGSDSLKAISPVALAGHADAPILLIHGDADTVVPIEQTNAMERALGNSGRPVERLTMKGEDHWLSRQDTRVAMLQASVAFVEKYNPPDPPPPQATSAAR